MDLEGFLAPTVILHTGKLGTLVESMVSHPQVRRCEVEVKSAGGGTRHADGPTKE